MNFLAHIHHFWHCVHLLRLKGGIKPTRTAEKWKERPLSQLHSVHKEIADVTVTGSAFVWTLATVVKESIVCFSGSDHGIQFSRISASSTSAENEVLGSHGTTLPGWLTVHPPCSWLVCGVFPPQDSNCDRSGQRQCAAIVAFSRGQEEDQVSMFISCMMTPLDVFTNINVKDRLFRMLPVEPQGETRSLQKG
jgi:hypothetical protein